MPDKGSEYTQEGTLAHRLGELLLRERWEGEDITAELAEVENSVYRLATAVNKTQKRANALKNIILPRLTSTVKYITDSLEEKEREDFSRLKVIKTQKNASRKENT